MRNYKITVEKTSTGYSAYCNKVFGVASSGKNWNEVKENFAEAFQFHLEGLEEDGEEVPSNFDLEFSLDVGQFFEYYSIFNVAALTKHLKINPKLFHQF